MNRELARQKEKRLETIEQNVRIVPRVDIFENDHEILVMADLPGVTRKNLDIRIDRKELVMVGRVVQESVLPSLTQEFRVHDFHRSFSIPSGIEVKDIKAEMNNGVLHLHLPKSEMLRTRQITVQAG